MEALFVREWNSLNTLWNYPYISVAARHVSWIWNSDRMIYNFCNIEMSKLFSKEQKYKPTTILFCLREEDGSF